MDKYYDMDTGEEIPASELTDEYTIVPQAGWGSSAFQAVSNIPAHIGDVFGGATGTLAEWTNSDTLRGIADNSQRGSDVWRDYISSKVDYAKPMPGSIPSYFEPVANFGTDVAGSLMICLLLPFFLMKFKCFVRTKAFLKKHSTKIKTVFFLICSFVVGLALYMEIVGFSKWEGGWINENNEMLIIKQDGNQISMYYRGINMKGGSFDDNSRVMTSYRFSGGSSDLIMRLDRTQNNSFDAWLRLGISSKDEKFTGTFHRR